MMSRIKAWLTIIARNNVASKLNNPERVSIDRWLGGQFTHDETDQPDKSTCRAASKIAEEADSYDCELRWARITVDSTIVLMYRFRGGYSMEFEIGDGEAAVCVTVPGKPSIIQDVDLNAISEVFHEHIQSVAIA